MTSHIYELQNSSLNFQTPPKSYPVSAPVFIWNDARLKKDFGLTTIPSSNNTIIKIYDEKSSEPDMDVEKTSSRKSFSRRSLSIGGGDTSIINNRIDVYVSLFS